MKLTINIFLLCATLFLFSCGGSSNDSSGSVNNDNNQDSNVVDNSPETVKTNWTSIAVNKHDNAGYITFTTSRIKVDKTGIIKIVVERVAGFQGAVSVNLSTYSTTGDIAMTAGVNFTELNDITISYADGEAGQKYVELNIISAPPPGLHMFGISMDSPTGGVKIRHPEMHIYFDDGGVNTSATIATATNPNDLETKINSATAGTLIYARAGIYTYNNRTAGQQYGGYTITNASGIKTAPIIVSAYPSELPVIDQQYANNNDRLGNDTAVGFLIDDGTKYLHIKGFEIRNTLYTSIMFLPNATNYNLGIVIEDNHLHDAGNANISNYDINYAAGTNEGTANARTDNIGGVRLDRSIGAIIRNNTIHDIYSARTTGSLSNPFNSQPYALHSGIHGYDHTNAWIHNNTIHTVNKGIFYKNASQAVAGGEDGFHVHHNNFNNIQQLAIEIGVQGGGVEPAHNFLINNNLATLDASLSPDVSLVQIKYRADVVSQPKGLVIWNNTQIGGDMLFYTQTINGIISYNNVLHNAVNTLALEGDGDAFTPTVYLSGSSTTVTQNQLDYSNYNCYSNITSFNALLYRNTPLSRSHTSLAGVNGWNTAFSIGGATDLNQDPDVDTIESTPTFVDPNSRDYRTLTGATVGTGRFARDIGIGSELPMAQ